MEVIAKEPSFKAQEVGNHIGYTGQDVICLVLAQDWKGEIVLSSLKISLEVLFEF